MGKMTKNLLGKMLFGILCAVVLPSAAIFWAIASEATVSLPPFQSNIFGLVLLISGLLLMIIASITISVFGEGLPMSPFPPAKFVSKGIYRIAPHPIYVGACFFSLGLSIYFGSASGLWLVSPIVILGIVVYVQGFERHVLDKRFPENKFRPLISLPIQSDKAPTLWNRLSVFILVLVPWFFLLQMLNYLKGSCEFISINISFLSNLSFVDSLFLLALPLTLLTPLSAKTQSNLREFAVSGLFATATGFYLMVLHDPLYLSFPSFYIIWTGISLSTLLHQFPKAKFFWLLLGIAIFYSPMAAGYQTMSEVMAGLTVVLFVKQRRRLWEIVQKNSERLANSWKEWNFGWTRLLNYGFYGALVPFFAVLLVGMMIGEKYMLAIFIVSISTMVCSALWAQFIEGSGKLLRPFGFYGGVLGAVLGCYFVSTFFDVSFLLILAATSVAAPFVQAVGRLRCLVQGCCHGSLCKPSQGIRYYHEKSRVVKLSNWKGEFVYPTPVYSILANLTYGGFLIKLWFAGTSITLLIGLSFIFNGLSRFVEESYRGEPQTATLWGLRLYQWITVISIFSGALFTIISSPISLVHFHLTPIVLAFAIFSGLVALFLGGVDFPKSDKRFSRLV
jgi:protein-S-isoprenylcysteine O-methyltransferase Ste14|tara:strand:- start:55 stop:1908 length:1854 start_codon:yes stop_codon:yes gene_type:complete